MLRCLRFAVKTSPRHNQNTQTEPLVDEEETMTRTSIVSKTCEHSTFWYLMICMLLMSACIVLVTISYPFVTASSKVFWQSSTTHHGYNSNDGTWYNFSSKFFRLYAYSAFYDDRPSLLASPVIRIIVISDPIDELDKQKDKRLYCVLHYDDKIELREMREEPKPVGFGWPLKKKQAREYVYTCPTTKGKIPHSVSFRIFKGENFSTSVPVTIPQKPKMKQEFCVCVQVAFGDLDPYRLIEWLEIQRLLGVTMVGVYDLSISPAGLGILKHYSREGFVDLRKTKAIFPNDDRHYLLQGSPVINDCIYRHMYEFRRIAVFDFDEFIMPRKHESLPDLVNYLDQHFLEKKSPHVNYAFRNNYFFLDLPPDESISPAFTVLRFRKKVAVSDEGYSVKSIINPQACTHMHNHYCWGLTANYSKYGSSASVDPKIALNQHYKKCHFSKNECDKMMKNATLDDIVLRLQKRLIQVVAKRVGELGIM